MTRSRMGDPPRRILGALLALGITVAVAAFGRLPTTLNPDDRGALRLSWRLRASQAEHDCRRPPPEELEDLPAHMQNPEACAGPLEPYRLRVVVDGRTVVDETIQGAGARRDRPIYVFREIGLAPGRHRVGVSFRHDGEEEDDALELELERSVEIGPRRVTLVTYDPERRSLVLRRKMP